MTHVSTIPTEVREAICAFIDYAQDNAHTVSLTDALDTVRRNFPDIYATDVQLTRAITKEAMAAHVRLHLDVTPFVGFALTTSSEVQRSLENWDNEGGAIGRVMPLVATQEQRRWKKNDTDGERRRRAEVHRRNRLV